MPDVAVIEWPRAKESGGVAVAVEEAVAEPIKVAFHAEPLTEGYIEIRDLSSGNKLVTTIGGGKADLVLVNEGDNLRAPQTKRRERERMDFGRSSGIVSGQRSASWKSI